MDPKWRIDMRHVEFVSRALSEYPAVGILDSIESGTTPRGGIGHGDDQVFIRMEATMADDLVRGAYLAETTAHAWQVMREQAKALVASGFLPRAIRTPEQAVAVIIAGRELGLGPMQSCRAIHIIEGKPTLSAELMAGLVYQRVPGATLRIVETTSTRCTVEAGRPGAKPTTIAFTLDDAKAAGIAGKQNWKTYPRAMLRSRAISEACRAVFPDATMGVYTADELGAVTTEDGAPIIDATPEREVPPAQLPSAPAEVFRFDKGEYAGALITEVPTDYIDRLLTEAKHPIGRRLRTICEDEIERRIAVSEARAIQEEAGMPADPRDRKIPEAPPAEQDDLFGGTT